LKILAPLILVLPGLLAFYLHSTGKISVPLGEDGKPMADQAYGILVQAVMPTWMSGFFSAVLLGAILSSFNSALNSTCTLFSLGIYKGIINKEASEQKVVTSGKYFGWAIAALSMIIAPMLIGQKSIFDYLQQMNGIYFVPIFAVVLVGMLSKRVPAKAANVGMIFAFVTILTVYFVPGCNITDDKSSIFLIHNFHFIALVLLISISIILIIGKINPLETAFEHKHSGDVDLTPWKYTVPAGITLIAIVVGIYASYADMSVIGDVAGIEKITAALFLGSGIFAVCKFVSQAKSVTQQNDDPSV
jgi:SSS family solute:Na+ symporter